MTGQLRPYRWGERLEVVVRHHARRAPHAIAVEQDGVQLSYGALGEQSDRVAAGLAAAGVRPEDVVPLLVHRSPELVVAILGVLRAGATYVAMDPSWPVERVDEVVRVSRAPLVVRGVDAVRALAESAAEPPPWLTDGAGAAAVFFTSGSSGTPKGVLSPHRGPIRTLVDYPALPLDDTTVMLQGAPLAWDGLSLELWAPLLNGGRCVLLGRTRTIVDVPALAEAIERGVDTLWLTSSLFNVLVDTAPELFDTLRLVMVGGERVSARHLRAVLECAPALRLVNGYGPAESTIFTTTHVVEPADVRSGTEEVPIGEPVPCTQVLVLDDDLRPLPAGHVGELAVAGDGLALAYLGNPEESDRRFLTIEGLRYYRTGDFAVEDAHGRFAFRGRRDRQVKIRGVRVELGEVDAVLAAHPRVASCCTLALPADDGTSSLATAYSTVDGGPVAEHELRRFAAARLLPAMIPDRLSHLERLPSGATGKVDVAAVARLLSSRPVTMVGVRTDDRLLGELAALVRLPDLRADDNLVERGVTSLEAVRVAAWLGARLGTELGVGDLYRLGSLDALRAGAGRATADFAGHGVAPAPLSHAQQRFWLAEQMTPGLADNMVIAAYQLTGPLRPDLLGRAVNDVTYRQAVLRDRYLWVEDGPAQLPGEADATIEVVPGPTHECGPREAAEWAVADWWQLPIDVEDGPLLRLRLVRVGPAEHLLCLQVHHIAFDGWSEQVFVDDLAAAYDARLAGAPPPPPLVRSYTDYSRWEQARSGAWLEAELPFWRRSLAGAPPPVFPRTTRSPEGVRAELVSAVPAETVAALQAVARRAGAPAVATIAAATARALGAAFDRPDVCLGTVTPGRAHPHTHELVGYFVNPLVLPFHDVHAGGPERVLASAAATVTSALSHARTPFDELVRVLSPSRERHPWFQAFAVMQHPLLPRTFADGVRVRPLRLRPPRTALELMVEAFPAPDGSWQVVTLWRQDGAAVASVAGEIADGISRTLTEFAAARSASAGGGFRK